jgi:hypothetical protein
MKDAAGDVHGVMYLRVPAATVHSGKPVVLKVGGTEGGGSWFMLHHFEDTYAQAQSILALPSGRRLVIAPPRTLFLAPGQIGWSCPFALVEGEDFPADVIHLQARLKKDADELSLEQQLRIQPDQRQVELALWSAAETSAGDWEITLTFSGADGVELLRWQSEISVRDT